MSVLRSQDKMDDGTVISLKIEINDEVHSIEVTHAAAIMNQTCDVYGTGYSRSSCLNAGNYK